MTMRAAVLAILILSCFTTQRSNSQPLAALYKKMKQSVVVIATEERMLVPESNETTTAGGLGSGVLISKDGMILTAAHVVHVADRVAVKYADGSIAKARVIATEPDADVALIRAEKVSPTAFVATVGNSDSAEVGDEVFIIGAPLGLAYSLSSGHISARHAPETSGGEFSLAEVFQTDASINKGNSGGPMFDMDGNVVGVVSFILSQSGGFEGLGFAVTSNTAREVLIESRRPWGGVDGYQVTGDLAKALNIPQPSGLLVQRVAKSSFGEKLGLEGGTLVAKIGENAVILGGDIILEIQGISTSEKNAARSTREKMSNLRPGTDISIVVWRWGKRVELKQRWYPEQ